MELGQIISSYHYFTMNFQQEKSPLNYVRNIMKELIVSTDLSDVTLICEDKKQIRAHKNILGVSSNFFREIFKSDKSAHQMIYLRGIQFSEMELIMHYVYLGEATFKEERIEEFLAVAKSLEIKGLQQKDVSSKTVKSQKYNNQKNAQELEEPSPMKNTVFLKKGNIENSEYSSVAESQEIKGLKQKNVAFKSTTIKYNNPEHEELVSFIEALDEPSPTENAVFLKKGDREVLRYSCGQCGKDFVTQQVLKTHIESVHEGIMYDCNQCDYQATEKSSLRRHINRHNGNEYKCQLCEFKTRRKGYFNTHIKSMH